MALPNSVLVFEWIFETELEILRIKDRIIPMLLSLYWVLLAFTWFWRFPVLLFGSKAFHLISRTLFESHENLTEILPSLTGFYLVLLGYTWFYWVLLDFTGFYWVLLGFTGFYWVLPSFTGFSPDFTGFYQV